MTEKPDKETTAVISEKKTVIAVPSEPEFVSVKDWLKENVLPGVKPVYMNKRLRRGQGRRERSELAPPAYILRQLSILMTIVNKKGVCQLVTYSPDIHGGVVAIMEQVPNLSLGSISAVVRNLSHDSNRRVYLVTIRKGGPK
jgi:hypothetical protein